MSAVRLVVVDGKRYDLSTLEVIDEVRCESCGEFVATPDLVTFTADISTPDGQYLGVHMHFHRNHILSAGTAIVKQIYGTPPF